MSTFLAIVIPIAVSIIVTLVTYYLTHRVLEPFRRIQSQIKGIKAHLGYYADVVFNPHVSSQGRSTPDKHREAQNAIRADGFHLEAEAGYMFGGHLDRICWKLFGIRSFLVAEVRAELTGISNRLVAPSEAAAQRWIDVNIKAVDDLKNMLGFE